MKLNLNAPTIQTLPIDREKFENLLLERGLSVSGVSVALGFSKDLLSRRLRKYEWGGYFDKDVVARFEDQYGIDRKKFIKGESGVSDDATDIKQEQKFSWGYAYYVSQYLAIYDALRGNPLRCPAEVKAAYTNQRL